jgi:hypothetical protein
MGSTSPPSFGSFEKDIVPTYIGIHEGFRVLGFTTNCTYKNTYSMYVHAASTDRRRTGTVRAVSAAAASFLVSQCCRARRAARSLSLPRIQTIRLAIASSADQHRHELIGASI